MQMVTTNEVIREIGAGRKQALLVVRRANQITGWLHGVAHSPDDGPSTGAE